VLILKGLIISSGDIENYESFIEIVNDYDYILCADGGLRHAQFLGITPDAIIGDFDSISKESLKLVHKLNIPMYRFPIEKNETDTELALKFMLEKGYKNITLIGATGSRIDHTLANMFLLRNLLPYNAVGKIVNNNNIIYLVNNKIKLTKKDGYYISIIPISTDGVIVSLEGFYYPLKNEGIPFGSTLGISNKIIGEQGIIRIKKGEAIIIEAKD